MKVTISDIAQMAGVSKATVSRVINEKSAGVGEETRRRILQIIETTGYLPNSLARSIVVAQTHTLGLVIPDVGNPFFPQIVQGIVRCARENGYTVFLCTSDNNPEMEDASLMSLIKQRVDGVVLISSAQARSEGLAHLKRHGVPVVLVDRFVGDDRDQASVVIDNRGGTREAVTHLLRGGHTRLAFLGGTEGVYSTTERLRGFRDAVVERGLRMEDMVVSFGHYDIPSGVELMERLLDTHPEVTAVMAGCDLIGIGALKACRQRGVQVPERIELVGFDGIEMAEVYEPPLSTVAQPIEIIAQEAIRLLLALIDGDESARRHIVVDPRLTLRATTRER